ncbi:MAG TPA: hypothetical protein VEA59_03060 [Patescibacteria group bacterium]|nr:hypothetical protein [Patescibacteria group bacterium]
MSEKSKKGWSWKATTAATLLISIVAALAFLTATMIIVDRKVEQNNAVLVEQTVQMWTSQRCGPEAKKDILNQVTLTKVSHGKYAITVSVDFTCGSPEVKHLDLHIPTTENASYWDVRRHF